MFDRLTSSRRRLWTTLAATGALFFVVLVLLGVQMALGRDPSMGDRTGNGGSSRTAGQALAQPRQQDPRSSGGPRWEDDSGPGDDQGYGYDDGGPGAQGYGDGSGGQGYGDGYGDGSGTQQQAPQQQGPPLQSGTS